MVYYVVLGLLATLPKLQQIICLGLEEEKQHLGKVRKIGWAPQQARANLTMDYLALFFPEALPQLCLSPWSLSQQGLEKILLLPPGPVATVSIFSTSQNSLNIIQRNATHSFQ